MRLYISLILLLLTACVPESKSSGTTLQQSSLESKAKDALSFCKRNNINTDYCFLIDMSIHSGKNRFFVWNFNENKITHSGLVCHGMGKGSTPENPVFSNENGSNCTSLGKYKLGARSYSKYGIHIHYKMHGLEASNNNAFKRIVVLHSYTPVPTEEIYPLHLPMGFSLGCPVISNELMTSLDIMLQKANKPILLWIYN